MLITQLDSANLVSKDARNDVLWRIKMSSSSFYDMAKSITGWRGWRRDPDALAATVKIMRDGVVKNHQ